MKHAVKQLIDLPVAADMAIESRSPFNCQWIQQGSETRVSNWTYAVRLLFCDQPRLASESECARCAQWESPDHTTMGMVW
jgi:hypothetical protein